VLSRKNNILDALKLAYDEGFACVAQDTFEDVADDLDRMVIKSERAHFFAGITVGVVLAVSLLLCLGL